MTYALIAANAVAWVVLQGAGLEPALSASICELGLTPAELTGNVTPGQSIQVGPQTYCSLEAGRSWHTVASSMFMHGGWMHILGNMWFLWIFGNNVEDAMGRLRFVVFYLLCGLAAAAAQIAIDPASPIPQPDPPARSQWSARREPSAG